MPAPLSPIPHQAWRHLHATRQHRHQAALAARCRIELGRLRRCLHSWRQQCGRHELQQAALRRARAQLQRSLLLRCWREWRLLCGLRWWKVQLEARDAQMQLLGAKVGPGPHLPDGLLCT